MIEVHEFGTIETGPINGLLPTELDIQPSVPQSDEVAYDKHTDRLVVIGKDRYALRTGGNLLRLLS